MVSTAGGIVIAILVLAIAAAVGWVVFTQMRARRLGLPPPTLSSYLPWSKSDSSGYGPRPATGGVVGWFNDQVRKFKNRNNRSATGAYEGSSYQGTRRGFGALDPDEAWDTRVDHEGGSYGYEPQELESRPNHGAGNSNSNPFNSGSGGLNYDVGGDAYHMSIPRDVHDDDEEDIQRGRKPSRDIGPPPGQSARNPFDDDAGSSLRGVSPRPMDAPGMKSGPDRPSLDYNGAERRSVFREDV